MGEKPEGRRLFTPFHGKAHRGSRWVTVRFPHFKQVARSPACYAIYVDGKIFYIGQTVNMLMRLRTYCFRYSYSNSIIIPWGQQRCQRLKIKIRYASKLGDQAMREQRLIHRLQPPFNCVGSTRRRNVKPARNSSEGDPLDG